MVQFLDERLPRRFWDKVSPCPMSGCWIWIGAAQAGGYGSVKIGGRSRLVHRFAYEVLVGPIDAGLQVDHRCRMRACCNPLHLEAVTPTVNVQRSTAPAAATERHAAVTHCPAGHPYDEHNTIRWSNQRRRHRLCRLCSRKHGREYARRARAAKREARANGAL